MQTDTLLLIDSFAQIFRTYYAVRSLTNTRGEPTNAVFGMMHFLLKLEEKFPNSNGAFVFDTGRPQHRLKLAPDYKANRPPTPENLIVQIPVIRKMIQAFGWNIIEAPDCEADDLIASMAVSFRNKQIRIVSSDKDLAQIIDDRVQMLLPDKTGKGFCVRGIDETKEKFGVPPESVRDYLAIIGDSVDNIPGVPGAGPKTAAQLLNQFGSIDAMLAHPEQIQKETLRAKITANADLLRKNIGLVALVLEPPAGIQWTEAHVTRQPLDVAGIRALAEDNALRSMYAEIDALENRPGEEQNAKKAEPPVVEQLTLF